MLYEIEDGLTAASWRTRVRFCATLALIWLNHLSPSVRLGTAVYSWTATSNFETVWKSASKICFADVGFIEILHKLYTKGK